MSLLQSSKNGPTQTGGQIDAEREKFALTSGINTFSFFCTCCNRISKQTGCYEPRHPAKAQPTSHCSLRLATRQRASPL